MELPFAGQPDIVLASQKDQFHTRELRDSVYSVAEGALGPQATSGAKPELNLLADFFYFFLTTFSGRQTLGEEYCDLYYFEEDGRTRISIAKRSLLAAMLAVGPYFMARCAAGGWGSLISAFRRETARERAAALQRRLQQRNAPPNKYSFAVFAGLFLSVAAVASRAHLAAFYWRGDYLDPIKRLFSARYIFTREPLTQRPSYRILSIFLIVQFALQGGSSLLEWLGFSGTQVPSENELLVPSLSSDEVEGASQQYNFLFANPCGICLSPLKAPACPPCGHVYCYECIVESCVAKSECPLCRREATPQSVQCVYV
jgi:peroxin-10